MRQLFDVNDKLVSPGDVIDIHQTVNGQNLFVIACLEPLDIRYHYDMSREYEYDKNDLLKPCRYSGEVEFSIHSHIDSAKIPSIKSTVDNIIVDYII
jgi:hypothetical protein